jgi:hypothetical protein
VWSAAKVQVGGLTALKPIFNIKIKKEKINLERI